MGSAVFVSVIVVSARTGVRAKTSGDGKGEPQPLLLRVTDLAVLPNRVKKNLKDCFVVANAVGDCPGSLRWLYLTTLALVVASTAHYVYQASEKAPRRRA